MEPICEQPLVVITGPTASGKTGISLELAEEFQIFGYFGDQYKIEAKQDIDRIRVLLGEEDESLPFKAGKNFINIIHTILTKIVDSRVRSW